jgi:hypothetical protein
MMPHLYDRNIALDQSTKRILFTRRHENSRSASGFPEYSAWNWLGSDSGANLSWRSVITGKLRQIIANFVIVAFFGDKDMLVDGQPCRFVQTANADIDFFASVIPKQR